MGSLWPARPTFPDLSSLAVLISICSSLGEQHRGINVTNAGHELSIFVCLEILYRSVQELFTSMSFFPNSVCSGQEELFLPCWNLQYPAKRWAQRRCSGKVSSGIVNASSSEPQALLVHFSPGMGHHVQWYGQSLHNLWLFSGLPLVVCVLIL